MPWRAISALRGVLSPSGKHAREARALCIDLVLGTLIFAAVWTFYLSSANPFRKEWSQSTFYERYYGTVVLSICQGRWQTPVWGQSQALDDFLRQHRNRIDCGEIPDDLRVTASLNYQAVNYFYLFKTVEWSWRWNGEISWSGLEALFGVLCATVSVCAYMVFRLGMGRVLAVTATVLYLPAHVSFASHIRDYAKAPFFLLIFWCLGFLVARRGLSARRLWITAAGLGLLLGVGVGYREDLMITLPAVVLTICAFLPWRWKEHWPERGVALALIVVVFGLARWPAARWEKRVFTDSHVTLLGLTDDFDRRLKIEGPPYKWSHIYSDPWVVFQIKSFSRYAMHRMDSVPIYGPEYRKIGGRLLREIVLRHPADFLIRAYAATSELLFTPWLVLGLLCVTAARAPRRILFLAFMLFYFSSYTCVQFHPRHFFHVELAPLWLLGFTIQSGSRLLVDWFRRGWNSRDQGWRVWSPKLDLGSCRTPALLFLGCAVGLWLPLLALRAYQTHSVEQWLEKYETEVPAAVNVGRETLDSRTVRLVPEGWLEPLPTRAADHYDVGYLVLGVEPDRCGMASLQVIVRYEPGAYHDFSQVLEISDRRSRRLFIPIYSRVRASYGDSAFLGLEMAPSAVDCVSISKVRDMSDLPPIAQIDLVRDWRRQPLYQRYLGPPGPAGLVTWLRRQLHRLSEIALAQ